MIPKGLIEHGIIDLQASNIKDIYNLFLNQCKLDGIKWDLISIDRVKYIKHYSTEEYRVDFTLVETNGSIKTSTFFTGKRSTLLDNYIEDYLDAYIYSTIRDKKLKEMGI